MKKFFIILIFTLLPFHLIAEETNIENEEFEDDTPVIQDEIAGERTLTGSRAWRAPNYQNQSGALGWDEHTFEVPKSLETNYKFWLDIYTKYTTEQGLIHDSEYIDLVYEVLDFTYISSRTDLNTHQKERLKIKMVKEAKKRVAELLKRLNKVKDESELKDEEEIKVWNFFKDIKEKNKFLDASKKGRLRFQLGQRDRIIQGIFFSGRYLESFEQIFKEQGLPIELTRLPFVESSFNVLARSKVGASGLWQIMRKTGKPYMRIDNLVDKRNDPIEATTLSTKLLKYNFNMLESWPLAITGYNHGPAGVLKLTKQYKSRDLGDLLVKGDSRRRLGFASRNFYASFLAILEAERNAPTYYGQVLWSKPLKVERLTIAKPITWKNILEWFDGKDKIAEICNPHITSYSKKKNNLLPKNITISVPASKFDLIQNQLQKN